jgi:hypothetical protein
MGKEAPPKELCMNCFGRLVIGCALMGPVAAVNAADISCGGAISLVMADYPVCGGNVAFKTTGTGGVNGIWMCAKSKEASTLIMLAQFSGKSLSVYIDNNGVTSCTTLPHYRDITYVISEQ